MSQGPFPPAGAPPNYPPPPYGAPYPGAPMPLPPPARPRWVLPLVLIVAVVVVAGGLTGYLLTRPSPPAPVPSGISELTYVLAGNGDQVVAQAEYPTCSTTTDSGCFTQSVGGGDCSFSINTFSGSAGPLVVTVEDKSGAGISGATVTLAADGIELNAQPSLTLTSGANGAPAGEAIWTSVVGDIPAGDPSGGSISVSASYTSGGISTTGSLTIAVEPPTFDSATNSPISC